MYPRCSLGHAFNDDAHRCEEFLQHLLFEASLLPHMDPQISVAPERLWISVFEDDDEAFSIWHNEATKAAKAMVTPMLGLDAEVIRGLSVMVHCPCTSSPPHAPSEKGTRGGLDDEKVKALLSCGHYHLDCIRA
ncbi:hypothetical protein GUJ93_ZPchr0583g7129 [Zizania palustris]|uniref:Uncharacterized protein n=1 Tax=Zizania palustris TaxID=103762 RepID=A0A8J5VEE0_ZIZPA|nr:hypothetical protein GUJ93_ZPchr0583g7129 [Zizania palustris]